jgi:hypothetical protein
MTQQRQGLDRAQATLLPEYLEDWIDQAIRFAP